MNITDLVLLTESLDSKPYEFNLTKPQPGRLSFVFEDESAVQYRVWIEFDSYKLSTGKGVVKTIKIGQNVGGTKFKSLTQSPANILRVFATMGAIMRQFVETPSGKKTDGFVVVYPKKFGDKASRLTKLIIKKTLKGKFLPVDVNYVPDEKSIFTFAMRKGKKAAEVFDNMPEGIVEPEVMAAGVVEDTKWDDLNDAFKMNQYFYVKDTGDAISTFTHLQSGYTVFIQTDPLSYSIHDGDRIVGEDDIVLSDTTKVPAYVIELIEEDLSFQDFPATEEFGGIEDFSPLDVGISTSAEENTQFEDLNDAFAVDDRFHIKSTSEWISTFTHLESNYTATVTANPLMWSINDTEGFEKFRMPLESTDTDAQTTINKITNKIYELEDAAKSVGPVETYTTSINPQSGWKTFRFADEMEASSFAQDLEDAGISVINIDNKVKVNWGGLIEDDREAISDTYLDYSDPEVIDYGM